MQMTTGTIVAILLLAGSSFFLWAVFFKLPLGPETAEDQELEQLEELEQQEDLEELENPQETTGDLPETKAEAPGTTAPPPQQPSANLVGAKTGDGDAAEVKKN
jgi:hypothetical protein